MTAYGRTRTSILVVEPRAAHALWMEPALRMAGLLDHRIERDPRRALHAYLSGSFNLILAAWPLKIEGHDWIAAAKSLRCEADPPVIAMISGGVPLTGRWALDHHADDTIAKPFSRRSLIDIVRKHAHRVAVCGKVIDLSVYRQLLKERV